MGGICTTNTVAPDTTAKRRDSDPAGNLEDHITKLQNKFNNYTSIKDGAAIEAFLRAAYRKANREEALSNILTHDSARAAFGRFLQYEYYRGHPQRYEEAMAYLTLEVHYQAGLSPSLRYDNASTTHKRSAQKKKAAHLSAQAPGQVDLRVYNAVIHELATNAFRAYLNSGHYKGWRAAENGSVQALRSAALCALERIIGADRAYRFVFRPSDTKCVEHGAFSRAPSLLSCGSCGEEDEVMRSIRSLAAEIGRVNEEGEEEEDDGDYEAELGQFTQLVEQQNRQKSQPSPAASRSGKTVPAAATADEVAALTDLDIRKFTSTKHVMDENAEAFDDEGGTTRRTNDTLSMSLSRSQSTHQGTTPAITGRLTLGERSETSSPMMSGNSKATEQAVARCPGDRQGAKATLDPNTRESVAASAFRSVVSSTRPRSQPFPEQPSDAALLMGSTWLAMLVSGVECISIAFALLRVPPVSQARQQQLIRTHSSATNDMDRDSCVKDFDHSNKVTVASVAASTVGETDTNPDIDRFTSTKDEFIFVYVNKQFERDFGYRKSEITGRPHTFLSHGSADIIISDADAEAGTELGDLDAPLETISEDDCALQMLLSSGRDGCVCVGLRRRNGRGTRTFICTRCLFDTTGTQRYVVCISVNLPAHCMIKYGSGNVGYNPQQQMQLHKSPRRNSNSAVASSHTTPRLYVDGEGKTVYLGQNLAASQATVHQCNAGAGAGAGSTMAGSPPQTARQGQQQPPTVQADMIASFNSHALLELVGLLPSTFMEDEK